jgi:hypothetical protein
MWWYKLVVTRIRPRRRTTMIVRLITLALLAVCAYALLLIAAHNAHPCYVFQGNTLVYQVDNTGGVQLCSDRKWWLP